MKVVFSPQVRAYFQELEDILFGKEYFGFEDSAIQYVRELFYEIRDTLPNRQKKKASVYFNRYGKGLYYSVFKKNNNTRWYVFFNHEDDIYYIRYIGNNHACSQYLP
jgi:hypothetical protein